MLLFADVLKGYRLIYFLSTRRKFASFTHCVSQLLRNFLTEFLAIDLTQCVYDMAAARSLMAKTLSGTNAASPKTPSNAVVTEAVPLHITPLDSIDSERDPDTPHKVSEYVFYLKLYTTVHVRY